MNLLREIRNQPEHIRHIFMWLCVVTVFSLISFVWFKSTQARFVAMLHPEEVKELERKLAREDADQASPLSGFKKSWATLRASLGELINGESLGEKSYQITDPESFRALPLSKDK